MAEPDEIKTYESTEDTLQNIHSVLKEINFSLKTIADFFEKWTDFDADRPSIYVSADVATHKA